MTWHRPHVGKAIPFPCPLSTVVQGIFSHVFFYIFTFTNLLWTLWTLWTYKDLLVKRLQNLKSDDKPVHSTVHGSSQLWTDHSTQVKSCSTGNNAGWSILVDPDN